jgi:sugar O-acyltransferase (sialic acid O-acetyltransferase NeuD family)
VVSPSPNPDARSISLIGAGGHARVVAASARRAGLHLQAVFEADSRRLGQSFAGLSLQSDRDISDGPLHIAIGSNRVRSTAAAFHPDAEWTSVIDPASSISEDVDVGAGSLIGLGACVQTGVRIGRHTLINTGTIVDHDCILGNFVHIAPGAVLTGSVTVGEGALIGAGAVVLPGLIIGAWAVVGAGAVVTRPVADGETVIGSPARVLNGDAR